MLMTKVFDIAQLAVQIERWS